MLPALCFLAFSLTADEPAKKDVPTAKRDGGADAKLAGSLRARLLGPAVTSGRVVGFAVDPTNRSNYFAIAASGGVWKTINNGATWTPVFDGQGSYSIGCITLDPKDPKTVWVGTGENNSQRSVGYGDGLYKSTDGGSSWTNVGLRESEHIGKIAVDPRDSNVVYAAAQGPLWKSGGDRGLYKTADGGKTWNSILNISADTGISDIVVNPQNPDILLCSSYQRRRHVWTLVDGGPECALHRSTDGGKTWKKITAGLPGVELGRIGLAMAPTDPNIVYATVEAADKKGGTFRSADCGATFTQVNDFDQQAQYYSHPVVDPTDKNRLYLMGVMIRVSADGGRTLGSLGSLSKHVDNHEIWIDPAHPDFYRVGCDGGIYESHDRGATWHFTGNLPITQFYDVAADEAAPFYHVYGGTQDNFTLGGPARTRSRHGIMNQDWFVVQGGDGFHCKVDPKDPNTVYGEYQHGGLCRYDRKSGTRVGIQPQSGKGEAPLRWNWDSPLALSIHDTKRLYFAANRLFRSDDRGDSWTAISPDLSRQIDRDTLPVFGKVPKTDAVSKHVSTSLYGNVTALAESQQDAKTIYAGTDDGLIQITNDGGQHWTKVEAFPGVPERTYVAKLVASQHGDNTTVYAAFDNHKMGDFKPYLLKSVDGGKNWASIAGDLPARGTVYCLAEDFIEPSLLFAGTEFGLYTSFNGGTNWQRIAGGLPTIQVKDLCIQKQMNDLVIGTFGRGIYVIDDYSVLRKANSPWADKPGIVSITDGLIHPLTQQYGGAGRGSLGEAFYLAENPYYGATITYHVKDALKGRKQKRLEAEKAGGPPAKLDDLRKEAEEDEPVMQLVISDSKGEPVRILAAASAAGVHRAYWDMHLASGTADIATGPIALPANYRVQLRQRVDGEFKDLGRYETFRVLLEDGFKERVKELQDLQAFQKALIAFRVDLRKVETRLERLAADLETMRKGVDSSLEPDAARRNAILEFQEQLRLLQRAMSGDSLAQSRNENSPTAISQYAGKIAEMLGDGLSAPTTTAKNLLKQANEELAEVSVKLKSLQERAKHYEK